MEMEGVDTTHSQLFPFSGLRVLGSLQVLLGTLCVLLGVADLALLLLLHHHAALQGQGAGQGQGRDAELKQLESMTVASAPIWCGTWFVVTGSLGACVSRSRSHSLKFLKISFLVLSVLCTVFFGPTCAVLSCMIAIKRHTLDYRDLTWLVTSSSAVLGLFETVIALVSASMCCCCAPLTMAKVHILIADSEAEPAPRKEPQPPPNKRPRTRAPPKRRQPEQAVVERVVSLPPVREPMAAARRAPLLKEAVVQTDPPAYPPPLQRQVSLLPLPPPTLPLASLPSPRDPDPRYYPRDPDPRYPVLQRPSQPRRVEFVDEAVSDSPVSRASFGYDSLRKWALPYNK